MKSSAGLFTIHAALIAQKTDPSCCPLLRFWSAEAGRPHAAIHSGSQHHQPLVCALGPGGGDRLHHPGPVHRPVRREPGEQEGPLSHPQKVGPLPLQQLQSRWAAPKSSPELTAFLFAEMWLSHLFAFVTEVGGGAAASWERKAANTNRVSPASMAANSKVHCSSLVSINRGHCVSSPGLLNLPSQQILHVLPKSLKK